MSIVLHYPDTITLDQLMVEIQSHIEPGPYVIYSHGPVVIERHHELIKGENLRASWKSRLISIPPLDGRPPRGPSEYYDLKFYPLGNQ